MFLAQQFVSITVNCNFCTSKLSFVYSIIYSKHSFLCIKLLENNHKRFKH